MGYPVKAHIQEAELTSEFADSWGYQSETLSQSQTEPWFQGSRHQRQQLSADLREERKGRRQRLRAVQSGARQLAGRSRELSDVYL